MSLILICWPFYVAIKVYKALAFRPEYPIILQSGIEILEGGEPEEEVKEKPQKKKKANKAKKAKKAKKTKKITVLRRKSKSSEGEKEQKKSAIKDEESQVEQIPIETEYRDVEELTPEQLLEYEDLMAKKQKLQEHFDDQLVGKYGGIVETLEKPPRLGRGLAAFYVWFQFIRKGLMAVICLALFAYPVMQILLTLVL